MLAICRCSPVAWLSIVCRQTVGQESTDKQAKDFWQSYSSDFPDNGNFVTLILFQSKTGDFLTNPKFDTN